MARPLPYEQTKPRDSDPAGDELRYFLQLLHENGVLRFPNDALATAPQWLEVVGKGLNRPDSLNALQNIALLLMTLGRIPPEKFDVLLRSMKAAAEEAEADKRRHAPPGLRGAFKLLHDRELWDHLGPLLEGLDRLGAGLKEEAVSPASRADREG